MGRKPLPTAIKEARGSFVKDPQRKNHKEPKVEPGRPEIPTTVNTETGRLFWENACDLLAELGVLTVVESHILESYCLNEMKLETARQHIKANGDLILSKQGEKLNPMVRVWSQCLDRRIKLHAELGLTPSAKTRLQVTTDKNKDDPLSKFYRELGMTNN